MAVLSSLISQVIRHCLKVLATTSLISTGSCVNPTSESRPVCVCVCVFSPQRQLGRTDFPHNALPHNVSFVHMCVFSSQRPTRMHAFFPQCTFPTMYRWYVCVYFPHNDQLGCTDFPHNALSPQCIVGVCADNKKIMQAVSAI